MWCHHRESSPKNFCFSIWFLRRHKPNHSIFLFSRQMRTMNDSQTTSTSSQLICKIAAMSSVNKQLIEKILDSAGNKVVFFVFFSFFRQRHWGDRLLLTIILIFQVITSRQLNLKLAADFNVIVDEVQSSCSGVRFLSLVLLFFSWLLNEIPLTLLIFHSLCAASDIIHKWRPSNVPEFMNTREMNLFNDNVNYQISSFADLQALNEKVAQTATKFEWFDEKKSAPVLQNFLINLEIIQTMIGSLDEMLLDRRTEDISEIHQEAAAINSSFAKLQERIRHHHRSTGQTFFCDKPHLSFDPTTIKGVAITLSADGRHLTHSAAAAHCSVSTSQSFSSGVIQATILYESSINETSSWLLVGVHGDPPHATANSYQDHMMFGLAVSKTAGSHYIYLGNCLHFLTRL